MNFSKTFKQAMVAMLSFAIAGGPALAARTTTYLHTDAAGSVVAMTNDAGAVIGRKDYAPFGEQIHATPVAERTSYTGKQHDDIIGLTYFGARWFDPELARFTSVDPVSFVDQHTMSFNRYLYAFDNPYKFLDPDGQFGFLIAAAFILVGLVASDAANAPDMRSVDIPQGDAAKFALSTWAGSAPLTRASAARQQTTVLGENMKDRVIPYAQKTGGDTLKMGSKNKWEAKTPKERWKLNDGQVRQRINRGDEFEYIGKDPARNPAARERFDLTRSELDRLKDRGVNYKTVDPQKVAKTIGQP